MVREEQIGEVARLKFVAVDAGIRGGRRNAGIIVNYKVLMILINVYQYYYLKLSTAKNNISESHDYSYNNISSNELTHSNTIKWMINGWTVADTLYTAS